MIEPIKIAGTGHRPNKLGGYGQEAFDKLISIAKDYLIQRGNVKVISGMALGWDTALAIAALKLKLPLIAAIPFKGQETKWPEDSQAIYNKIIERAYRVVIVNPGTYHPHKMQLRNEWMVDHCDEVLAMFDGSKGGTYNCIKYAEKQGKPIVNLYDKLL